ncbi:GNAT family N-acetyltransferase [Micromonospora echinofusca]|uniref:GNAT family N-acetyltransferase n=1 Tax=Micromonospora echinofusca TaxID=47858 RepID=A0ABS3VSQ5_MICEH|nr:GNAT family N-acetyltransferase [Micromonospora echinofusca]MBO4207572.1 GNAT family N-acetyltransferase [Micromonospora echinofusca]
MRPVPVEGDGVRLRLFLDDDVADLATACADPLVQRFVPAMPDPYTRTDAHWWVTEGAPAVWAGGGAAYAVVDPATDRLLGGTGIAQVVPTRGQAEIGYWVAPWARGRGVATAAVRALTGYAFTEGLARVELLTHPENAASQRVALAAGYRREGVRQAASPTRDGGRQDLVAWIRLAGDPAGPTPRLLPDLPTGRLTDGVVTLRPLTPADAGFLHGLHTRPEVVAVRVPPVPPDRAWAEQRCALAAAKWLAGEAADLVIEDAASGVPAGNCALVYEDPRGRQAMIGYSLLPDWRGRGVASRAVRLLARWAFSSAGIARLSAGTIGENVASWRVLERVGFRREGLLRQRFAGFGMDRSDEVLFGLLPDELTRGDG